jgi:WD40 repeat protein
VARVFVSHSSTDEQVAAELNSWLQSEKHEVFLDQDARAGLLVGDEWESRLYSRLRWAEAIVCVISRAYVQSAWCTAEVAIAKDRGIDLLPVPIEPLEHPLMSKAVIQYTPNYAEDPQAARMQLKEKLNRLDPFGGFDWTAGRSPFPGLQPFETDMHTAFFGRRADVDALVRLLRSPASRGSHELVIVVGASGCGKSSLVRAGLVPVIAREQDWLCLEPIVPGREPVAALAREMTARAMSLDLHWTLSDVRQRLLGNNGGFLDMADELILAGCKRRGQLLVVVDQFEELFNQGSRESAGSFARLLQMATGGPVQVVATIRPESMQALLTNTDIRSLQVRPYPLRPLGPDGLREVIEGPSRLAGFKVDSTLVDRLVADTGTGEALPLLAFTLAEVTRGLHWGERLSTERYEQLGGVKGSLQRQADEALTEACAATGRRPAEVINGLLELVTPDERGDPTRRRMPLDELPKDVQTELQAFVEHRLLTTDLDATSERAMISVAHEAFLSAWPPIAEATKAQASGLRSRRDVEAAANDWNQAGRPSRRLWEGNQLAAAVEATGARLQWTRSPAPGETKPEDGGARRAWAFSPGATRTLTTDHVHLSPVGGTFVQRSIVRERWRRRRATTILSVLLALAIVAAGIAVGQRYNALTQEQQANLQRHRAIAGELMSEADALRSSQPRVSLLLGVESQHLQPAVANRRGLATTLMQTQFAGIVRGQKDRLNAVAISPDGYVLATASGDSTVMLWDLRQGMRPARVATLAPGKQPMWDVAFSPSGRTMATSNVDGTVTFWDVSDPSHPLSVGAIQGHGSAVYRIAFSLDGKLLATASDDGTSSLWDVSDPKHPTELSTLTGHTGWVDAVAFSPDGHLLATAGKDATPLLWDIRHPGAPIRLAPLTGHTGPVYGLSFSPDGLTLASTSTDWTGILWDLTDPIHPRRQSTLTGFTDTVTTVAFSPDGQTLATGNGDHTIVLWNVADRGHPSRTETLSGHTDRVTTLAFSPHRDMLVSGSWDGSAILWYTSMRPEPALLDTVLSSTSSSVASAAISPDGRTLVTGNSDGTSDLWDLSYRSQAYWIRNLTGHSQEVSGVAFSPDGKTLATASLDHYVILWNLADRSHPTQVAKLDGDNSVLSVAFSPDGRSLAATTEDNKAILWDVSDPTHPNRMSELPGYQGFLTSLAFSPDRRTLVTGGTDGVATVWDIKDRAAPIWLAGLQVSAEGIRSVAISPDGRVVATGSADQTMVLWDIHDRVRPLRLATISDVGSSVLALKFDPSGQMLVTSTGDNTATIWDVSDRSRPIRAATMHGLKNVVTAVAINDQAGILAVASWDGHTQVWDLDDFRSFTANAMGLACNIAGPDLSRDEWKRFIPQLPYDGICSKDFPVGDRCVVGSWLLQDEKMGYSDPNGNAIIQEGGAGAQLTVSADGTAVFTYDQPGGSGSRYTASGSGFNASATLTGVSTSQVSTGSGGTWNETIQLDNTTQNPIINGQAQPAQQGGVTPSTSYKCSGNQLVLQGYGDTQTWTRTR